ncbi:hypothetical protein [Mycetocola zhadangensis]|uniref:DNA mismatch repair protein n=1 Tax=Mycetocola zhadangensis TaxID=1164595 RepID=A0A3L7J5B7_9MICO|nr:hypothetical protein [Mycetocola zhadangensis]RLQ85908.1 hypothetical protein D9V28_03390 [Mycetocola zhadangensis]GGE86852.1 hypothetical protein GCM10011313_06650 [Mycetocola zhadangensis]
MGIATGTPQAETLRTYAGVELVSVHDGLWRVRRRDGRILGHVERSNTAAGDVYIAKRFHAVRASFLSLGQFWNIQDAVDCLR